MDVLPKDVVVYDLASKLDYNDILNFCQISKYFQKIICNNVKFWRKIVGDYGVDPREKSLKTLKKYYKLISLSKKDVLTARKRASGFGYYDLDKAIKSQEEIDALYGIY